MTADGAEGNPPPGFAKDGAGAGSEPRPVSLPAVLDVCDRLLGEIGRRPHVFAWLRAPDGDGEGWLPVDAYYPAHRLVVVCRAAPGANDHLYRERIPRHGLRLLMLEPEDLGEDLADTRRVLEQMIATLDPIVTPPPAPEPQQHTLARTLVSLMPQPPPPTPQRRPGPARTAAAERGARFVSTHPLPEPRRSAALVGPPAPVRPRPPAAANRRRAARRRVTGQSWRKPPPPTAPVFMGVALGFVALVLALAILAWILGV